MGIIRESNYNPKSPATMFGFDDWPEKSGTLLDDISQTIHIKRGVHTLIGCGEVIDSFTYDEYEEFIKRCRRSKRIGKQMRDIIEELRNE